MEKQRDICDTCADPSPTVAQDGSAVEPTLPTASESTCICGRVNL